MDGAIERAKIVAWQQIAPKLSAAALQEQALAPLLRLHRESLQGEQHNDTAPAPPMAGEQRHPP